jgi:hypothetical protein
MSHRVPVAAWNAALASAFVLTLAATTPTSASAQSSKAQSSKAQSSIAEASNEPAAGSGCFIAGNGYLRARLRGALDLDLDWKNAEMDCAGGPRPGGQGVRVSIGGPSRGDGRRIRIVFGISGIGEGVSGETLGTNVTLLFEGEQRIFATQGDDKCTVDSVTQKRVEPLGGSRAVYRVEARGFCLGPATSLSLGERLFITSFDFAGRVEFGDDDRHETSGKS